MAPIALNATNDYHSPERQQHSQCTTTLSGSMNAASALSLPASRRSIFKLNKHGQLKFVPRIKKCAKGVPVKKMLGPSKLCFDASQALSEDALKALYEAQAKRRFSPPSQLDEQPAQTAQPAQGKSPQVMEVEVAASSQLLPEDLLVFPMLLHFPFEPSDIQYRTVPVPTKAHPDTAKAFIDKVKSLLSEAAFEEFSQAVKQAGKTPHDQKAIQEMKTTAYRLFCLHGELLDELEQFLPEELRAMEYVEPLEEFLTDDFLSEIYAEIYSPVPKDKGYTDII